MNFQQDTKILLKTDVRILDQVASLTDILFLRRALHVQLLVNPNIHYQISGKLYFNEMDIHHHEMIDTSGLKNTPAPSEYLPS